MTTENKATRTRLHVRFPLSLKISAIFAALIFVSLMIVGVLSYRRIIVANIEPLIGKRLDFTARGIALLIPGEIHERIFGALKAAPEKFESIKEVEEVHKILILAQRQNELTSDIKTFAREPLDPKKMIRVMTSNEDLKIEPSLSMDPYVESVFRQGIPIFTPIFTRDGQFWISGLTPIETEKGEAVAVLRVDYAVDEELNAARRDVVKTLTLAGLLAFALASAMGLFLGRSLSRPVRALANAAKEVSSGNLEPVIDVRSKDEIGYLASAFDDMLAEIRKSRTDLETYSRTLEQKVEKRTSDLNDANQKISAMLDCLGQGFFMFDREGKCLPFHSKACLTLLEGEPGGMAVTEFLRGDSAIPKGWVNMLFQEPLPFEDLVAIGPTSFPHSKGHVIELDYQPVRNSDKAIQYVIGIATDRTAEVEAKRLAELERGFSKLVLSIAENRQQFIEFLSDFKAILLSMKKERLNLSKASLPVLMRGLHTLKGIAGLFNMKDIKDLAHRHESLLASFKQKTELTSSDLLEFDGGIEAIEREFQAIIHRFRPLIGEEYESGEIKVVVSERRLMEFYQDLTAAKLDAASLSRKFSESFLFEPIEKMFKQYGEVVNQAAESLGKCVKPLVFHGGNLQLNPRPYKRLFGAFVHAFRNAVDHGLETADEREATGKPEFGEIQVDFQVDRSGQSEWLAITVKDDGAGVNVAQVREKLKATQPTHPLLGASDKDLIQVIFESGFSTRELVTDWSGRGFGLDALWTEARKLGGTARIASSPGVGAQITVRVPFTGFLNV